MKNTLRAIGIMSGTSLDGVDFVLSEVRRTSFRCRYLDMHSVGFPKALRTKLCAAASNSLKVSELSELHFDLGRFYAQAYEDRRLRRWGADVIGLHGQTVYHRGGSATLQIGEGHFLREKAKIPVVSDFRAADIAAGGQGAPLATSFHRILLKEAFGSSPAAFQNLGGIGNVTFMSSKKIFAFDTGPANLPLDIAIQHFTAGRKAFDLEGQMASEGVPNLKWVKKLLKHSFLTAEPPKSAGREQFGEPFVHKVLKQMRPLSRQDIMATLTEWVAQSVAEAYRHFLPELPKHVILAGGGARNSHLVFRLRYNLPEVKFEISDSLGWPTQAIEGGAFGWLAACRLWEVAGNVPKTTGAHHPVVLGSIN